MSGGTRAFAAVLGTLVAWLAAEPAKGQAPAAAPGSVVGQVLDPATNLPIQGVTVTLRWPRTLAGDSERQETRVTDLEGAFEFPSIPAGYYEIRFAKDGYRETSMTNFGVQAGQQNRADFPMHQASGGNQEALELEAFVVSASMVNQLLTSVEMRMEADQFTNVLTAEEFAKFAASDVAEAAKRIPGLTVMEGEFTIIRGLEDRYSSTLFNSAPIPSPDPDRQSVQVDLFPSEVVSNLVVAKTFGPELPGNSSSGSLDIVTSGYPAAEGIFDGKLSARTGLNDNAWDEFLRLEKGSPVGNATDGADTLEQEYGGFMGGRSQVLGREVRYKVIGNWGTDYHTAQGFQEGRAPSRLLHDLSFGRLGLTDGRYDLTASQYEDQLAAYGGLGFDLDEDGNHRIDGAVFWTSKDEKVLESREQGFLPGYDYSLAAANEANDPPEFLNFLSGDGGDGNATRSSWLAGNLRKFTLGPPAGGHAWFDSFFDSKSFDRRRDLQVYQVNGDHHVPALDGLHLAWATNYATTSQDDEARGARFYFEPCGIGTAPQLGCPSGVTPIQVPDGVPTSFPVGVGDLGPGKYLVNDGIFFSGNGIDEEQSFGRLDGDYGRELLPWLFAEVRTGLWYENATRDVDSAFLDPSNLSVGSQNACSQKPGCLGSSINFAIFADTAAELGRRLLGDESPLVRNAEGGFQSMRDAENKATREIQAWNGGAKATLWQNLDLLGGVRVEQIAIESKNDPFQPGQFQSDGSPRIFPSKYLFFDRPDNCLRGETCIIRPPFNDQILGIQVPSGPCRDRNGNVIPGGEDCVDLISEEEIAAAVNGKIDEVHVLPSAGIAYRPLDGLALRAAWSQTVARPSFREIGYYVSVEPGTDDLTVGNPQLQLSEVQSWDTRAEYTWGEVGDLAALSFFYKDVKSPIEQIILRDPSIRDTTTLSLFRTFYNNPNDASVWGVELEARKNLGFVGSELLGYFSLGGNFTYIGAEVKRSEFELARSEDFFQDTGESVPFRKLKTSRRLTNQPEWIGNADLSFHHPEWGTKVTLAIFAISDVLDAVGGATEFDTTGDVNALAYVLDRYVDAFEQLDLVVSQEVWGGVELRFSAKNLLDGKRGITYDPAQTSEKVSERRYRVGRDYSLGLSWAFSGPDL